MKSTVGCSGGSSETSISWMSLSHEVNKQDEQDIDSGFQIWPICGSGWHKMGLILDFFWSKSQNVLKSDT